MSETSPGQAGERTAGKSAALRDSRVSGSVIQAGEIQGGVHFHATERRPVRPRELPLPPVGFTDREPERAALDRFADEAAGNGLPLLVVVSGIGGTGKSALLRHWLHRRRADFPDGELYVDLHGLSAQDAMPPGAVLRRFLRSLGVAPERVPAGVEESVALYRTLTADRRVCVLADNAVSAAQVRTLLPGAGASLVAVTSRRTIPGLLHDGARFLDLHPLDEQAALALLEQLIGPERALSDPEAARELVEVCGRLPVTIGAVAARMNRRRFLTPDRIVRALSEKPRRLAASTPEESITVHTIYDQNYAELSFPAKILYSRLGLLPGLTFTLDVMAVLMNPAPDTDTPDTDTRDADRADTGVGVQPGPADFHPPMDELLDELLGLRLVEEVDTARFRVPDMARPHAEEKAERTSPEERTVSLRRVVAWHLARAAEADRCVLPGRERIGPAAEDARRGTVAFASAAEALDWLDAELPDLMVILRTANGEGFHEDAWQICEALWGLFVSHRPHTERVKAGEIGLASARACGDVRAQVRMLAQLGAALVDQRRLEEAETQFTEALHLARETGFKLGEASAVNQLGMVRLVDERPDDAIPYFSKSVELHAAAGSPRGAALVTRRLGEAHRNAGRYAEAVDCFREAIVRFTGMNDRYNMLVSYLGLGRTRILAGEAQLALEPLDQAQEIARTEGARFQMARVHRARADAHKALNDPASERSALMDALPLLEQLHEPTDDVLDRLRRLPGNGDS